jgi:hypothetical protein
VNLADPTVGDIIDRLSILSMKEVEQRSPLEETRLLLEMLKKKLAMKTPDWQADLIYQVAALGAVNGRLWELHERPVGVELQYAMALNQRRRVLAGLIG